MEAVSTTLLGTYLAATRNRSERPTCLVTHGGLNCGSPTFNLVSQMKMEMTTPVLSIVSPVKGNQSTSIQFVMEER